MFVFVSLLICCFVACWGLLFDVSILCFGLNCFVCCVCFILGVLCSCVCVFLLTDLFVPVRSPIFLCRLLLSLFNVVLFMSSVGLTMCVCCLFVSSLFVSLLLLCYVGVCFPVYIHKFLFWLFSDWCVVVVCCV